MYSSSSTPPRSRIEKKIETGKRVNIERMWLFIIFQKIEKKRKKREKEKCENLISTREQCEQERERKNEN